MIILGGSSNDDDNGMENKTFDIPVEDISSYNVGDEITITIKGCIGMVSIPPEVGFGEPKIGIKVYSQDIKKTGSLQVEEIRKLVESDMPDYSDEED